MIPHPRGSGQGHISNACPRKLKPRRFRTAGVSETVAPVEAQLAAAAATDGAVAHVIRQVAEDEALRPALFFAQPLSRPAPFPPDLFLPSPFPAHPLSRPSPFPARPFLPAHPADMKWDDLNKRLWIQVECKGLADISNGDALLQNPSLDVPTFLQD